MLAGLIAACLLAAEPELAVEALGPARPGGVLRVAVRGTGLPADAGPAVLVVELLAGAEVLAAAQAELSAPAAVARQPVLALTPDGLPAVPLRLRATLTWSGPHRLSAETAVASPGAILAEVAALAQRLRVGGETDPLPWLWAEQAAELAAGGASAAGLSEVQGLAVRLAARLDGQRDPPRDGQALRDPIDGSVQPWRLHLPAGAGPFPFAVLLPEARPRLGKARWPRADARLLGAALAAGVAVVECYPAGDAVWSGVARRRIALAVAEAGRLARLDPARAAAVAWRPVEGLPWAVHHPGARGTDPLWWSALPAAPRPAAGAAAGWADRPFAVVVGGAEHAAAAAANRRLAEAFRAAYAAHAHAVVDLLADDVDPRALADRNLVLVGNPRSNRLLSRLALDLPFTWDHRRVSGPGGFTALRSAGPSLACLAALGGGRLALVLDGVTPPWGPGLPLASLALPYAAIPAR